MKFGRNDPCWCGSGRKYKKCHLDRENQAKINPWDAVNQLRSGFSRKLCSVPKSLQSDCKGQIVRSHTVSLSSSLRNISRDGHVYSVSPTFDEIVKSEGQPVPQLIGISQASTFTGFCAYHDRELFSPLENQSFTGSKEQLFLLGFRALCRELYYKQAVAASLPMLLNLDRGLSILRQAEMQAMIVPFSEGTRAGERNIIEHKVNFDKMLLDRNFTYLHYCLIEFDQPPAVMGSGGIFPEVDFAGNQLQDLGDLESTPDMILFSSFSSGGVGYFCFVWHQDYGRTSQRLVDSFLSIPQQNKTEGTIRFMFEFCENIYLKPIWWETRTSHEKNLLINRIRQGSPIFDRRQNSLVDDGLRIADWNITNILTD